jgi:hypothetical protein
MATELIGSHEEFQIQNMYFRDLALILELIILEFKPGDAGYSSLLGILHDYKKTFFTS